MSKFLGTLKTPSLASAPSSPIGGQLYYNSVDGKLYLYDAVTSSWTQIDQGNGPINAYTTTVGDGASVSFVITHNLNTQDIYVMAREANSPFNLVEVDVTATSTTQCTITFTSAPSSNQYRVVIGAAAQTPWSSLTYTTTIGDGAAVSYAVAHNLNTRDVSVTVREAGNNFEIVDATVKATDANTVTVEFTTAPTSNQYSVLVQASYGGSAPTLTAYAPLASPTFTGTPAAPTAAVDTNTTRLATTAFVLAQAASANPVMDGSVAVGTSTRYARADHVHATDTSRAPASGIAYSALSIADSVKYSDMAKDGNGLAVGAFHAYRSAALSVATGAEIVWDAEIIDVSAWHSTSTGRYTPQVKGYYVFTAQQTINADLTSSQSAGIAIGTNGTQLFRSEQGAQGTGIVRPRVVVVTPPILMNGSTDYVSVFSIHSMGGSQPLATGNAPYWCFFGGYFLGRAT